MLDLTNLDSYIFFRYDFRSPCFRKWICTNIIMIIMVLARSMSGTIGGHAPIISIHDTWCAEARGSRDTNRGWPHCPVN